MTEIFFEVLKKGIKTAVTDLHNNLTRFTNVVTKFLW